MESLFKNFHKGFLRDFFFILMSLRSSRDPEKATNNTKCLVSSERDLRHIQPFGGFLTDAIYGYM